MATFADNRAHELSLEVTMTTAATHPSYQLPTIDVSVAAVWGGTAFKNPSTLDAHTEDATSGLLPRLDLGIPLAWGGIPRLVREIGPALTKELVMTCRPFGAAEAQAAGFLNRVVPVAELDAAVDELAEAVAARPRFAVLATKAHTNAVTSQMVGLSRSWGDAEGLAAGLRDDEGRAAREAYLERVRASKGTGRGG